MPIIDVEVVCSTEAEFRAVSTQALADAAGAALSSPPGRTWVRLHRLDSACYAENGQALPAGGLPAFVTVLQAHPPQGAALAAEVQSLTGAIAEALGLAQERVHVQYAPAAAGRQAFGGVLVQ